MQNDSANLGHSEAEEKNHHISEVSERKEGIMPNPKVTLKTKVTLGVLVLINLLNYMDRYTLAGVLTMIQKFFGINNKVAGLLNTVFIVCYMIFAPLFGYLGDRYSRKYVMAVGVLIWSAMTFVGSLMEKDQFYWFFFIRGLVGIGEASYSTVAPTIIADLFVGDQRTKALSLFYFAIPCGSGLGYMVGSKVANAAHKQWQWAFRVTPGLGVLCVIFCMFVIHEPKRGALESQTPDPDGQLSASVYHESSSYWEDLRYLFKIKSFLFASIGFACISFVIGAVAFWAPEFVLYSERVKGKTLTIDDVSYNFGIVTFISGVVGVWVGSEMARRYRKYNKKSDAIICGFGVLASVPFLFLSLYLADKQIYATWTLIAIGEILLCLNWTPNADLLLYVIVPDRRSTAEAAQILFIHLFGDALSPFIVGWIADAIRGPDKSNAAKQQALFYALLITPFIGILGFVAYWFCGEYLESDKAAAEALAKQNEPVYDEEVLNSFPPTQTGSSSSLTEDNAVPFPTTAEDTASLIPAVAFKGNID